jgi:hypothetical protein
MIRRRTIFLSLAALTTLALAQDSFSPARTYAAGEKDTYGLSLKIDAGQYDIAIVGKIYYMVKKAFENGDADIESRAGEMMMTVMGQETKQPAGDIRVLRYNKFGVAIEKGIPKEQRQPLFMKFLTYRPSQEMKVGQTVKISEVLEDENKTEVKGTAKLENVTDGIAKISSSLDITGKKGSKPLHIDSTGYYDAKTSKLNRTEAKVTNVDPGEMPGLPPITSITAVIEREK